MCCVSPLLEQAELSADAQSAGTQLTLASGLLSCWVWASNRAVVPRMFAKCQGGFGVYDTPKTPLRPSALSPSPSHNAKAIHLRHAAHPFTFASPAGISSNGSWRRWPGEGCNSLPSPPRCHSKALATQFNANHVVRVSIVMLVAACRYRGAAVHQCFGQSKVPALLHPAA